MKRTVSALILAAVGTACAAAAPVPNDRLAASEAASRGAHEAGADKAPQAKLALKLSEDETARAKLLIADGKNDEAARVLEQARVDAELAVGLAREAQAVAEAEQALEQSKALQSTH